MTRNINYAALPAALFSFLRIALSSVVFFIGSPIGASCPFIHSAASTLPISSSFSVVPLLHLRLELRDPRQRGVVERRDLPVEVLAAEARLELGDSASGALCRQVRRARVEQLGRPALEIGRRRLADVS